MEYSTVIINTDLILKMKGEYVKNHEVNQPFICILPNVPLKELNISVTFAKSKDYEFCSYITGKISPKLQNTYFLHISATKVHQNLPFSLPHQKKSELKNFPDYSKPGK